MLEPSIPTPHIVTQAPEKDQVKKNSNLYCFEPGFQTIARLALNSFCSPGWP